ncbi:MAG: TonB-dependent receptor plug domain-containing protein, partial [Bacteroidales bacterium]
AGVAIVVEGSSVNTITNAMGEFSIKAPSNGVLDCSMLGMIPDNMPVLGRTSIPVLMEEDIQSLQGVVVTGYQTLSRDRATGSFGSITAESMENKPLVSVASVLEGKVAGLSVDSYGKLSIRGVSTFIAGKEPLIVVDGFPVEQSLYDSDLFQNKDGVLEGLNPDNIESITVLKDAVAASIYGARAANGVVVVVTRKGQQGGTKVSYKGTFSAKTQPRTKDLHFASVNDIIDAQLDLYNSLPVYSNPYYYPYVNAGYYKWMADNGFMSQDEATSQISSLRKNDFFKEVDKYLFRPELTQQHNLQISGGNEKDLYNVSANYTGTRGNFKYASDRKLTVDVRNDWRFNQRVSLSMSMNVNYSSNDSPILNPAYGGTRFDYKYFSFFTPSTSFVDANGNAKSYNPVVPFIQDTYSSVSTLKDMSYNLLENLQEETYHTEDFQARINAMLNIKIFDGLSLDLGGNWQRGNYMYRQLYTDNSFYARRVYNNGISLANNA